MNHDSDYSPAKALSLFHRNAANPIITPSGRDWRGAVTFNPAAIKKNGTTFLFDRCAGSIRPFHCFIGLHTSEDGVHFQSASDQPVISPADLGSEYGSVQDPRVTEIEGSYYMTVAYRPFAWASNPTGVGVPESHQIAFPGFSGRDEDNQTRSAILKSPDLLHWEFLTWVSPAEIDDRNVILFSEKVAGKYWITRRPSDFVGTQANHSSKPKGVMISHSDDLITWSDPEPLLPPLFWWEDNRLGGSTPPIKTEKGWLLFYHGVETLDASVRKVCYRMGAALLDLNDPTKVIARCPHPIFEPTAYYEKFGLYIPDVVFPTAAIVEGDSLRIYYGACDTVIGLAEASLSGVVDFVSQFPI